MRAVIQRVSTASVLVGEEEIARIGAGLLALVAIHRDDETRDLEWMAKRLVELRIFDDPDGKLNLSLEDVRGELLLVSQFTLYGDCSKGRRPSYIESAPPDKARTVWPAFVDLVRQRVPGVRDGRFQASMQVSLINNGPVTLILDSR